MIDFLTKKYRMAKKGIFAAIFYLSFAFFTACRPTASPESMLMDRADSLLHQQTDSTLALLAQIPNPAQLPEKDYARWCLLSEHAKYILIRPMSPDSVMPVAIDYYSKTQNKHDLGRCYYVQGSEYAEAGRLAPAMTALKKAEELLLACDPIDSDLVSVTYYRMGYVSEGEWLGPTAKEYYEKALRYFPSSTDAGCWAYAYRELFRMSEDKTTDTAQYYFRQSKHYAEQDGRPLVYYSVMAALPYYSSLWEPRAAIACNTYLCDTLHLYRYAAEVAYAYLLLGKTDSCKMYLDKLALDTAVMRWSNYHYHYFSALYNRQIGNTDRAYELMKRTLDLSDEISELEERAQTVAIAKHYDFTQRETENRLLQTQARHKNLIIVATTLLLIVVATTAGLIIGHMRQKNMRQKATIAMQRNELVSQLKFRIACTQRLNVECSTGNLRLEDLPKNVRDIIEEMTYVGKKWARLLDELQTYYGDFFTLAKRQFPRLSDMDALLACLTALGLSHDDCIRLLWIPKNKYYRRRQLQKEHTGIESNKELDNAFAVIMKSIL